MHSCETTEYIILQECNGKTEVFHTDQGSEFVNYAVGELMKKAKCKHETSNAGDSPGNGAAERGIGTLWSMVRASIVSARTRTSLWGECTNHSTVTHNYSPCYANPVENRPLEADGLGEYTPEIYGCNFDSLDDFLAAPSCGPLSK